jgi:hypothetical protein
MWTATKANMVYLYRIRDSGGKNVFTILKLVFGEVLNLIMVKSYISLDADTPDDVSDLSLGQLASASTSPLAPPASPTATCALLSTLHVPFIAKELPSPPPPVRVPLVQTTLGHSQPPRPSPNTKDLASSPTHQCHQASNFTTAPSWFRMTM